MKTVSQLSGLNIPFAAKVTWGGVIQVTDAIGGVDVCLASGINDPNTGINWPAGTRNIKGLEALQFLRTRHGVGDGSDLGRISNQQQYMSRLARKLMSEDVLSNPATLYKLATTAVENITPSQSLTNPLTLVQIALAVKNVPFDEIVFVQYPVLTDPDNPNKVVPNKAAAEALWAALAANKPLKLTGDCRLQRRCRRGHRRLRPPLPQRRPSTTPTPGATTPADDWPSRFRHPSPVRPERIRPAPTATSAGSG